MAKKRCAAAAFALIATASVWAPAIPARAYEAKISWSAVSGATAYTIRLRHLSAPIVADPAARTRPVTEIVRKISVSRGASGASQLTHTVTNLPLGPAVSFSVRALDARGEGRSSKELFLSYEDVAVVIDSDGDGLTDAEEDRDLDAVLDADETDSLSADTDGDGVSDYDELYATATNPRVRDTDRDGIGDGEDGCNDVDGDGFGSRAHGGSCPLDNCPWTRNANQLDADADGSGDVCDPCTNLVGSRDFYQNDRLVFRRVNVDERRGDDGFEIEGDFRLPPSVPFAALDPAAQGARIRIENADGNALVDLIVPPGGRDRDSDDPERRGRGWSFSEINNTWRYVDRDPAPGRSVNRLSFKDLGKRWPNTVRIEASGKNGDYPVDFDDTPVTASIALGNQLASRAGACAETPYTRADCTFIRHGKTLLCE